MLFSFAIFLIALQLVIFFGGILQFFVYLSVNKYISAPSEKAGIYENVLCHINSTYYDEHPKFCYCEKNYVFLNIFICEILAMYSYYICAYIKNKNDANKNALLIPKLLLILFNCILTIAIYIIFSYHITYIFTLLCFLFIDVFSIYHIYDNYKNQIIEEYEKIESYQIEIVTGQDE
jgi:hypothetical protein